MIQCNYAVRRLYGKDFVRIMKRSLLLAMILIMLINSCLGFVSCGSNGEPENVFTPTAEIVNKDGADAVITYVIDDGDKATGTFAKQMLQKYQNLSFSFAVPTKNFATLTESSDGSEYVMTEDGKYVYTQTSTQQETVNFWKDILRSGESEMVSHTHTHAFWGTNDNGGEFEYVKNNSTTVEKATMPKGSSTKELYASKQLLEELFPKSEFAKQNPLTLIGAGISVRTEDFKVEGENKTITTYLTYFNKILLEAIEKLDYIGGRGTFQVTNTTASKDRVVMPSKLKNATNRRAVSAYMIVHANRGTDSIENWTAFIDHAIDQGGWASYCIHKIVTPDKQTGHYILQEDAEELFRYSASKNVWTATFTDALIYYSQWSTATVRCVMEEGAVKVTLTDREDDEIFNMPMTVKVTLPKEWSTASCNGEALDIRYDYNNKPYVYVNITPNGDSAVITGAPAQA